MTKNTREWYEDHPQRCQHEGCKNTGWPGFYPGEEDKPPVYVCDTHAREEGFCWGCHGFWAGASEFFDFDLSHTKLCIECYQELCLDETDEFDEYDDDDYDFVGLP